MATYNEKLIRVTEFVEENFDDVGELVAVLGLTVEDVITLLPDVLVVNYGKFFNGTATIEEDEETESFDDGIRDPWEEEA